MLWQQNTVDYKYKVLDYKIECYLSVKGVKKYASSDKNRYSVSKNKLLHTCTDHSKSDKN